ncbi:MAG TPA: hypothetical protein VGM17_14370 [Rhizomicrobium sp.]
MKRVAYVLEPIPLELRSAASAQLLDRGCVNVIGFDAIKEQAGPRWAKLRENVVSRLEGLLRHTLGPTDFFAPLTDSSYLVTMPAAEPQDVSVVCLRVAFDLYRSLLGRCDLGQIQIGVARDGGADLLMLHPIEPEQVIALSEKAGIREFSASPYADTVKSGEPAAVEKRPSTTLAYAPMWDTKNGAITTFIGQPRTYRVMDSPAEALGFHQVTIKERVAAELDALHAGVSELIGCLRSGDRFLLGIPITFEMIGSPLGRMELASACRHLLAEHRQYLIFMLTNVPPGVAQTRLADITNSMRPFARHVMATVAPGSRSYGAYQGIGLQAIGLDLAEGVSAAQVEGDIARLALAGKAMKLGTFVNAIGSDDVLAIARDTGIRWMSGPAILPPASRPHGMMRFTPEDLDAERNQKAA